MYSQRRIDQPQPVVGELRPHALPAGLVPPVLHVAFDELPRGGVEDVIARQVRRRQEQARARPAS